MVDAVEEGEDDEGEELAAEFPVRVNGEELLFPSMRSVEQYPCKEYSYHSIKKICLSGMPCLPLPAG